MKFLTQVSIPVLFLLMCQISWGQVRIHSPRNLHDASSRGLHAEKDCNDANQLVLALQSQIIHLKKPSVSTTNEYTSAQLQAQLKCNYAAQLKATLENAKEAYKVIEQYLCFRKKSGMNLPSTLYDVWKYFNHPSTACFGNHDLSAQELRQIESMRLDLATAWADVLEAHFFAYIKVAQLQLQGIRFPTAEDEKYLKKERSFYVELPDSFQFAGKRYSTYNGSLMNQSSH